MYKYQVPKPLEEQCLVKELEGLSLIMLDVLELNHCWHFVHFQKFITVATLKMLE